MSSPSRLLPSCDMEKNESPVRMEGSLLSQAASSWSWEEFNLSVSQLCRARPEGRKRETRRLAP